MGTKVASGPAPLAPHRHLCPLLGLGPSCGPRWLFFVAHGCFSPALEQDHCGDTGVRAQHSHRPRSRVLYLPAGEQLQAEETNRGNGDAEWEEKIF